MKNYNIRTDMSREGDIENKYFYLVYPIDKHGFEDILARIVITYDPESNKTDLEIIGDFEEDKNLYLQIIGWLAYQLYHIRKKQGYTKGLFLGRKEKIWAPFELPNEDNSTK